MIVLYQSYGSPSIARQVRFSVETLRRRDPALADSVVVYAQDPDSFVSLNVGIVPLTDQMIRQWKGPLSFVHRLKIRMIIDAMARFRTDVLYLDGDTFWQSEAVRLVDLIRQGRFVAHNYEGRMGENRRHWWLHGFLARVKNGRLPPFSVEIEPDGRMYNAGVLGLPYSERRVVFEVLRLTDELLLRCYQAEWLEQLAFSSHLSKSGEIATAEREVVHYWYDRYRSQRLIDRLLSDGSVPLLDDETFQRMYRELTPRIESRFSRTRRKSLRSIRKRLTYLKARRLAASDHLASREYRLELDDVACQLEINPEIA